MRFLAKNGVRPDRMRISCHGDVQPRIRTGDNRSLIHDRVEIHIIDKFAAYYRGPTDVAQ